MHDLLLLCTGIPRPAAYGASARLWRVLRHLGGRYRVHLGCFGDEAVDRRAEGLVRQFCQSSYIARPAPVPTRPGTFAWLTGSAQIPEARHDGLQSWVERVWTERRPSRALALGASLAHYIAMKPEVPARRIIDHVDLSGGPEIARWGEACRSMPPLRRWLLAREARARLGMAGQGAVSWHAHVVASASVGECLRDLVPEAAGSIHHVPDGIDTAWFSPDDHPAAPLARGGPILAFAGDPEHPASIEAIAWFAKVVLPQVRTIHHDAQFLVPRGSSVDALSHLTHVPGVVLTGPAADLRALLAHSSAVVAPQRADARMELLQAMAMAKPAVATTAAAGELVSAAGRELWFADGVDAFAHSIDLALDPRIGPAIGRAARVRVQADLAWEAVMERFDRLLEGQTIPSRPVVWPITSGSGR